MIRAGDHCLASKATTQQRWELDRATATEAMDADHAASPRRRYLIRFEEDMQAPNPSASTG